MNSLSAKNLEQDPKNDGREFKITQDEYMGKQVYIVQVKLKSDVMWHYVGDFDVIADALDCVEMLAAKLEQGVA